MKKCFPLLIFLWVCILQPCFASDFIWFRTSTQAWKKSERPYFLEGRISTAVLEKLDSIYKKTPQTYTFYEKGGKLFAQVNCTLDVYQIYEGDSLVNKYNYFNRGYNCSSHFFERDGTKYLFGGHGFWRNHMDLLSFDELHGAWELIVTQNQPDDVYSSFVYQNSQGLISLFGESINIRSGLDEKHPKGYFLDWKSKVWKEVDFHIEGIAPEDLAKEWDLYFIQTENYGFWASTNGLKHIGWNLIEKETGKIFYFPNKNIDMGFASTLEVIGNVLTYPLETGELKTLDLDEIRKKSKEVGYVKLKSAEAKLGSLWMYGILVLLIIVGGLWVKMILPKKKTNLAKREPIPQLEPIQALLPYSGQELTTEKFDQLLELDSQTNLDTRRMKRARLIKDINQYYLTQTGRVLIVRNKMYDDKRYVTYLIQG
ncbi:MAG: hypothetical protein RLZ13_1288 [Bacteroidota bacterium]